MSDNPTQAGAAVDLVVVRVFDAPVERVTGENAPMPYARNLELLKTPSKAKIAAAIRKVCYA